MDNQQKLAFGIEIVAAMKASCYNWDIEEGRVDVLMETETDRMEGVSKENWDNFTQEEQLMFERYCQDEKERLHKQALYVADIALKFLEREVSNG